MAMSSAGPELGEAQRQVAKCACGGLWRQLLLCHSLAAEAAPSRCQDLLLSPYQRLAPPFPERQVAAEGTEGPLTLSFLLAMHRLVQSQFQHIRGKKTDSGKSSLSNEAVPCP